MRRASCFFVCDGLVRTSNQIIRRLMRGWLVGFFSLVELSQPGGFRPAHNAKAGKLDLACHVASQPGVVGSVALRFNFKPPPTKTERESGVFVLL